MHLRIAAVVLLLAGTSVMAQETGGSGKRGPAGASALPYFDFAGGDLGGFVNAVDKQLGFNLRQEASVPSIHAWNLELPKLKIYYSKGEYAWVDVLITYNQISEGAGGIYGEWILHEQKVDGRRHFAAIIFRPPPSAATDFSIKAFHLGPLPVEEKERLQQTIAEQRHRLNDLTPGTLSEGSLSFDQGADILIAKGGPHFIELVTTLVEAFKERQADRVVVGAIRKADERKNVSE